MCLYKCGKIITLKKDLKVWAKRLTNLDETDEFSLIFDDGKMNYTTKRLWHKEENESDVDESETGQQYQAHWHFFLKKKDAKRFVKHHVLEFEVLVKEFNYIIPAGTTVQYGDYRFFNPTRFAPAVVSGTFINPRVREEGQKPDVSL